MTRRAAAVTLLGALSLGMLVLTPTAAAGGGCHSEAPPSVATARSDRVNVEIGKCAFSPTVLYIEEGTTVTWDNFDPVPHTVTGVGLSMHGDKYINAADDPVSVTFDQAGVFPYYCVLHPGMAAAVVVGDIDEQKANAEDALAMAPPSRGGGDTYERIAAERAATDEASAALPGWMAFAAAALAVLAVLAVGVVWRRRHPAIVTPDGHPTTAP